jgi:hypothetical protein
VPPQSTKVVDIIVDLCAQVQAQMGALRRDYQISIYEVCAGLNRQISKDMDRMVYHIRRLIDQNGFLYDRVVELEKRDDTQKVSHRNRDLQNMQKGEKRIYAGNSKSLASVQRGGARRQMRSPYRQAG